MINSLNNKGSDMNDRLQNGLYLNFFKVDLSNQNISIMETKRSNYQNLEEIRQKIDTSQRIHALGNKIYGYGNNISELKKLHFIETEINLYDIPKLTSHLILEGFTDKLKEKGYQIIGKKGRCKAFNWNKPIPIDKMEINIFQGFDIRSIYLFDIEKNKLTFGLVIDVVYAFKDSQNKPLNTHLIVQHYNPQALKEIKKIQGDLLPDGKINTEAARKHLDEKLLTFVKNFVQFQLPCGGVIAKISNLPMRIILGEKGENLNI